MTLSLYLDHNVPRSILLGLRLLDIDVISAYEDNASELDDPGLMSRATALGRVLFSMDDDLLKEAAKRQSKGIPFAGVIYGHQLRLSIGAAIRDLEMMSKVGEPEDMADQILFIPLRK